ncbi:phosphotransferase system glucitol/sorbitol-specific iia component [Lucifera butyrica]|uniref:Phosphotransferase system glucitol/sorbitol-specific iia component n=1 Tax=Lucifera butyrica TaxID=1351585 RepID=A0A498R3N3_9FIRM|nr:PTS glucitol/sorbitol transporter subunit IIA [Lucifera butyrica]VBB07286.1 phosphotransferase system glucitol/sorbitol-specific iia component [Lucifera butyrica]
MKYQSEITGWGMDALHFLSDKELNFIIIFNDGAPPELAEIAVLHKPSPLLAGLAIGDTVIICDKVFTITAIGSEAEHTLQELGHCTLSFKGGPKPDRPGCIMLEGDELLSSDILVGGTIEIF